MVTVTARIGYLNGQRHTITRKATATCTRCSHRFTDTNERMIDVQYPSYQGQAAVVTYRCRNKKACQKRAKKD